MSTRLGKYELRLITLGNLILSSNQYYMSIDEFFNQSHYIHLLQQEYIDNYKKFYRTLYLPPRYIIMDMPMHFHSWCGHRIKVMRMMLRLPEEVTKHIVGKETKDQKRDIPYYNYPRYLPKRGA